MPLILTGKIAFNPPISIDSRCPCPSSARSPLCQKLLLIGTSKRTTAFVLKMYLPIRALDTGGYVQKGIHI